MFRTKEIRYLHKPSNIRLNQNERGGFRYPTAKRGGGEGIWMN